MALQHSVWFRKCQAVRDRFARPLLAVTERIAGYRWDDTEVRRLLMTLSSTMTDELELLVDLPVAS